MKKILIFTDYFEPGYKAGGPIKSVKNILESLKDSFDFTIVTNNKDLGDTSAYSGIRSNFFYNRDWGDLFYTNLNSLSIFGVKKIIKEINPDFIYLNSFFSKVSIKVYICKIFLGLKHQIIIAPRGEFSPGALKIKSTKKKLFIRFFKLSNVKTKFHSTDDLETEHISQVFSNKRISKAPNLPNPYNEINKDVIKNKNELNLVFISRISYKKNLHYLIDVFERIESKINLDIYGPIEDLDYFNDTINKLNAIKHLNVEYKGHIENSKVINKIKEYHYFILPTLGENYGHAIVESILAKTPVIISDQTPWRSLKEQGVGFDISLSEKDDWIKTIDACLLEDQTNYNYKVNKIEKFIETLNSEREKTIELTKKIFQ